MPQSKDQTILLVEDTLPIARDYEECLRREGYTVAVMEDGKLALEFLDLAVPSAVVLELMLPDANGMEILQHAKTRYPDLPVIVVTATNSIDVAVEAMQRGAYDYIVKPVSCARLATTVRNALERKALITEVEELRQVVGQSQFHGFIGQSAVMQAVYRIIDCIAVSKASIFICGESGTGKELAAHAIHNASPRRAKQLIIVNCSNISHDKFESELFGYVKGAFLGAEESHSGAIVSARDGTLYLDEVCALPLDIQAKLMRFLQTGEIMPVGGTKSETVDVRMVASSNRDLLKQVRTGNMREDLYYRLHTVPLEMPALREREEDIIMLAQHFLAKFNAEENKTFCGFDNGVTDLFRRYDWPGNVRQLENVMRNVVVLHNGEKVTSAMLPTDLCRFAEASLWPANQNSEELSLEDAGPHDDVKPLWVSEKEIIMHALDTTNQDINMAATLLQISPSALYRKMQAWKAESMGCGIIF